MGRHLAGAALGAKGHAGLVVQGVDDGRMDLRRLHGLALGVAVLHALHAGLNAHDRLVLAGDLLLEVVQRGGLAGTGFTNDGDHAPADSGLPGCLLDKADLAVDEHLFVTGDFARKRVDEQTEGLAGVFGQGLLG